LSAEPRRRLYDISVLLSAATPPWPGDTPLSCGWTSRIADGSSVNLSSVTQSPHVGTHADAPLHVRDGAAASDDLSLDAFIGSATVVDVSSLDGEIPFEKVAGVLANVACERLLLKTGRSIAAGTFPESWPTLSLDCAQRLLQRGLRLLGVDCPSVDVRESKKLTVHHTLFSGSASILENLDLRAVNPGRYELIAVPVKLKGLDAAPVRAVLRELT
jgi:arylformamidase